MESIGNAQRLTSIFGRWPSFHDSEVHRVVLDRSRTAGPSLEVTIHLFEVTPDLTPAGTYVLNHHTLVTIRFDEVVLELLGGFNAQNVLARLELTPIAHSQIDPLEFPSSRLQVVMESSYGMTAQFECAAAEITEVRPYSAE
jgi:hypothetical protein